MKKIAIISIIILLLTTSIVFIRKNKSVNATLDTVSLKDVKENNMLAIMVNDGSGEYTKSESFPNEEGYKLNETKSGCMDNNGEKIENSLSFDDKTHKVTLTSNKTSYCYLYFDKSNAKELIKKLKSTQGLSTDLLGGMYRYRGSSVDNYICLKKVGQAGCSTSNDNDMYRIIGITEEGNIKVMKLTSIGPREWNAMSSASECSGNNCDWPNTDIYKTLNENDNSSFLSKLNTDIKNKIEPQKWWYGDIGWDYEKTLIYNVDETYNIETGKAPTQYYDKDGKLIESSQGIKWKQMESLASIGLIYLHDYYYQANEINCHNNLASTVYKRCLDNGWMNIMKNGGTSNTYEWTMTRIGYTGGSSTTFSAWRVMDYGSVNYYDLTGTNIVRPVFYLKDDIEIQGAGTTTEPFYIAS